ncbi:MAG: metal-sensing transcriptional repressor [Patescibacteria group bacterium]|jgi:DNA-binding FrmR family transcriptional regulator
MNEHKAKAVIAFKKTRSLMDKVIAMSEKNEYCVDIMQQNLAALGLLKSAHQLLLEGHLHSCFRDAMASNNNRRKQEMIEEILKISKPR